MMMMKMKKGVRMKMKLKILSNKICNYKKKWIMILKTKKLNEKLVLMMNLLRRMNKIHNPNNKIQTLILMI